jgi:hypothetical protein
VPGLWLIAIEPPVAPEEEEPVPDPAPCNLQRSPPQPVFAAVPCPPAIEPPVSYDISTGPFGVELLPVPEGVEPVPDPVPLRSTGLFWAEPLLAPVDLPPIAAAASQKPHRSRRGHSRRPTPRMWPTGNEGTLTKKSPPDR